MKHAHSAKCFTKFYSKQLLFSELTFEELNMEEILKYTANFGFPMVISILLILRIETKLESLGVSINELSRVIERIKEM